MAVLIFGDTLRSPALRHEIPLAVGDPFLYLETDERRAVVTNALEVDRIAAAAPEVERLLMNELGADELIAAGHSHAEVDREVGVRAVRELGIAAAAVPPEFPLAFADRLRDDGVELRPDDELFDARRRRKTDAELDGIRRATAAGLAALDEAARVLRAAVIDGERLRVDGAVLTAEALRARIRAVCAAHGAPAPEDIIVAPMRPGDEVGHEPGSGPLPAHAPLCVDLWPQDEATGCWSDMTRTWVVGEISSPVGALHELVLEAHRRALERVRPGVRGVDVYGAACEVHEAPALGRTGSEELLAGDVVAVEPGTVDLEHGGMRVEDLVIVTDAGPENLTIGRTYDLRP